MLQIRRALMLEVLALYVQSTIYIYFAMGWPGSCTISQILVDVLGAFLRFLTKSDRSPLNRWESHERSVTAGFPAYENLGVQVCRLRGRVLVEGHTGEAS